MSHECEKIHKLAIRSKRYSFPFDGSKLPMNGVYFLFEKGELGHNQDRIVRIGTHTGDNQLYSRLEQHFMKENKDRSIFRKNIGRALLSQANDPFIRYWEIDLTSRKAREKFAHLVDFDYQQKVETKVSHYIQANFSFSVIEVTEKKQRLETEARFISIVSWCDECKPSKNWLGNNSPKKKIVGSGLWQVNGVYKYS